MTPEHEKIKKALTRLLIWQDQPAQAAFFSSICLQLEIREDASHPTMATDGRRIFFNPEFVRQCTEKELMGTLIHETLHIAYFHHCRMGARDQELWNIACDLAINPTCLEMDLDLPAGVLLPGCSPFHSLPADKSAEEYYTLLSDQQAREKEKEEKKGAPTSGESKQKGKGSPPKAKPQPQPEQQEEEDNTAPGPAEESATAQQPLAAEEGTEEEDLIPAPRAFGLPPSMGGVLKPGRGTPEELTQSESETTLMVEAAHQIATSRGELPGNLQRIVQNAKPKVCWRTTLQDFLSRLSKHKKVWQTPNRRFYPEFYLPAPGGRRVGSCVFLIDTSGSISQGLLNQFAAEVNDFRAQMRAPMTVLWHDTAVYKTEELALDEEWQPQAKGGGGTSHVEAFAKALALEPELIVALTDCYSDYPPDPGVQSLFLRYGRGEAPAWGQVIDMEEKQ